MVHVQFCESCGQRETSDPMTRLTQMHATKRRFITTEEQSKRAAKVCMREHKLYEEATGENTHERMEAFVDALIAKRENST